MNIISFEKTIEQNFVSLEVNPRNSKVLDKINGKDWKELIPNPKGKVVALPTQGHAAGQIAAYLMGSNCNFTHAEFKEELDPNFSFNPGEIYSYVRDLVSERDRGGKSGKLNLNADRHDVPEFINLQLGNNTVTNEGWYKIFADKVVAALEGYDLDNVQITLNAASFGPANVAVILSIIGATGKLPIMVRSTQFEKAIDAVNLQELKNLGEQQATKWASEDAPVSVPKILFNQILESLDDSELIEKLKELIG